MKQKIDKNSADRSELESIIRKQSMELNRTQTLLSQADFDLKEARYEINRINERESKTKEEKQLIETKSKDVIAELKLQLQQKNASVEERNQVAAFECDKLIKTLTSLYKSVFDGRGSNALAPKTTKQLLDKAAKDAEHLRDFLVSKSTGVLTEEQERVAALQSRLSVGNVGKLLLMLLTVEWLMSEPSCAYLGGCWVRQCPPGHVPQPRGGEQSPHGHRGDAEGAAGRGEPRRLDQPTHPALPPRHRQVHVNLS